LEQLGFWACYSADETYHKDMRALFAAAAGRTSRLRMGPEVTHVILKDPTIIPSSPSANSQWTGRAVFSTGNFAMLKQYHVDLAGMRPIARLREAHHVLSTFLAAGKIDFQGDYYSYSGLFTSARPVQTPLPINWTFAGADFKRKATKWRCPSGDCEPKSVWRKASRLHPLIPRETKRWRSLYRGRAAVEREFGRLKNE
jgi:hypothetical protein